MTRYTEGGSQRAGAGPQGACLGPTHHHTQSCQLATECYGIYELVDNSSTRGRRYVKEVITSPI